MKIYSSRDFDPLRKLETDYDEMITALEYQYGISEEEVIEDYKNHAYTDEEIAKAIIYFRGAGLPKDDQREYYERTCKSIGIEAAEAITADDVDYDAPGKLRKGLWWDIDGHDFEVISISGDTCRIKESWIAEDSGKSCLNIEQYKIVRDDRGTEYAQLIDYPKFRLCSTAAFNYYPPAGEDIDDDVEDMEEYYTPSASRGDYGPSNPWDAPGMSVSDFI